jgi:predicted transcriptional regulator
MGMRRVPLELPSEVYRRLSAIAKAEDRDPVQQAAHIIRRALEERPPKESDE